MSCPIAVEYVWCSGKDTHHDLRSKVKTLRLAEDKLSELGIHFNTTTLTEKLAVADAVLKLLPEWNFDGSSTGQAMGRDTEVLLRPKVCMPHPFRTPAVTSIPTFVALCECWLPTGKPAPGNTRHLAATVFNSAEDLEPWFGLEQEYVFYKDGRPLGWPESGEPAPQGPYYCGTGAGACFGRAYAEKHYELCLSMGLKLSGTNAEVMPGQWEYQVGPCTGIESGDHSLLARWVMLRLSELEGFEFNVDSKPKKGDWNGSGMHCNFSTAPMRVPGGLSEIKKSIERMSETFFHDVAAYGADNNERLSGAHETSRLDTFNVDVGTRNTSCRIPNATQAAGYGYFEDRRPSSSADPYLVTARLFASACAVPSEELDAYCKSISPDWLTAMREAAGGSVKK